MVGFAGGGQGRFPLHRPTWQACPPAPGRYSRMRASAPPPPRGCRRSSPGSWPLRARVGRG